MRRDCFVARTFIAGLLAMTVFLSLLAALSHADTTHSSVAKVEKLFLMEKYEQAVNEADKLIDANVSRQDEIYYLKGLAQIKLKRYGFARESFEYILSTYSDSKFAFDAYTGIGDAYYLEGNTHSAMRIYNETLARFPRDKNISIIKRRLEDCNKRVGADYATRVEAAAPHAEITAPADAPKGNFSIQVGGFKEKRNADNLARKLAAKGYYTYVEAPASSAGDNLYRVKVGRLAQAEEARRLAARLKVSGYPTKICQNP
jgi:tetratricopeptide (TPR) repeat protein